MRSWRMRCARAREIAADIEAKDPLAACLRSGDEQSAVATAEVEEDVTRLQRGELDGSNHGLHWGMNQWAYGLALQE